MKKNMGFWQSLERYIWREIWRSGLPYLWQPMTSGFVIVVIVVSLVNVKNSTVGARNTQEAIELAVSRGDYQIARELFTRQQANETTNTEVLGEESELEDKVYPEKVVERRIAQLEQKLQEYPENRTVYLALANLYAQIGNQEMASQYREKARILDPNN